MKKGIQFTAVVFALFAFFVLILAFAFPSETSESIVKVGPQIWKHRTNELNQVKEGCLDYKGVEIDVVFEEQSLYFDVRHDTDQPSTQLDLKDFLFETKDDSCLLWIDLKNLSQNNVRNVISCLEKMDSQFKIKHRIIVESSEANALNEVAQAGYFTSYWVPHYTDSPLNYLKFFIRTRSNLFNGKFSALSAHYNMLPFLEIFYPKANYHLWTYDTDEESEKTIINTLSKKENVKVILVDYNHGI